MKRNSFIDVIKGVAILMVVFTHMTWTSADRANMLFPFWVNMAVPLFMLVSGYVYSQSYLRRNVNTVRDAYSVFGGGDCVEKLIRYTVPFAIAYTADVLLTDYYGTRLFKDHNVYFMGYEFGGYGQGSYYYPLMIQLVFLFPVIHFFVRKWKCFGVLFFLAIDLLYEYLVPYIPISTSEYRLQIYRYIFLISMGSYFGQGGKLNKFIGAAMVVAGAWFIYMFSYMKNILFFTAGWAGTSAFAALFIIPIFYWISRTNLHCKPIEFLGKASYNIFLVQMVWYEMAKVTDPLLPDITVRYCVNMVVCVVLGIGFYYLEKPVTKLCVKGYRGLVNYLDKVSS